MAERFVGIDNGVNAVATNATIARSSSVVEREVFILI